MPSPTTKCAVFSKASLHPVAVCPLGHERDSERGAFLTAYIGLELLSLALYALIALRRDSGFAAEAALKYFVLGALASGILLYGISMVYGATGSLEFLKRARLFLQ